VYWPLKLLVITIALLLVWRSCNNDQPFYGTTTRGWDLKPYTIMLALMIPLIALAATQKDFLQVYPKLKNIAFLKNSAWYYKVLYEISYGLDFFTIELFFRGFLVLGFAKWVGKAAILPMALFYCTIHFGKPLGECISSYFGGLILGAVTLHTRSIWGGLIVHVGIAWLMEVFGYIAVNW
jgi:membrane protease YdiL (CAAX protease family)